MSGQLPAISSKTSKPKTWYVRKKSNDKNKKALKLDTTYQY